MIEKISSARADELHAFLCRFIRNFVCNIETTSYLTEENFRQSSGGKGAKTRLNIPEL
jgi:hypothetical protein